MGFALWIDTEDSVAWAQGTHEYRPMGAAVIGITDQFRGRDFRSRRRCPSRLDRAFVGLFGSLEEVNEYLRKYRASKKRLSQAADSALYLRIFHHRAGTTCSSMRAALLLIIASIAFAAAPKAPPASDAAIEAAIRAKFAKSKISEDQFRVSVKSGIATLEGKTDVPQRKGVATRLAKSGGAREVVNKIQISEAARKKLSDRLQKARESRSKPASKTVQNTPDGQTTDHCCCRLAAPTSCSYAERS